MTVLLHICRASYKTFGHDKHIRWTLLHGTSNIEVLFAIHMEEIQLPLLRSWITRQWCPAAMVGTDHLPTWHTFDMVEFNIFWTPCRLYFSPPPSESHLLYREVLPSEASLHSIIPYPGNKVFYENSVTNLERHYSQPQLKFLKLNFKWPLCWR